MSGFDSTRVIDEALPHLHAGSRTDLAPYWSEAELIQTMDERLAVLAIAQEVFVRRDLVTDGGGGIYPLPARTITTLHVSIDGGKRLKPTNQRELEALDPAYESTQGPAQERWCEDLQGGYSIATYPLPAVSGPTLAVIHAAMATELDAAKLNTTVDAPPPLRGYLAYAVLGEAYGVEGPMEMPEVAAHCRSMLKLYEGIVEAYYRGN